MNEDKLFVIAIGGTGMRCLESFVHLCAIGMFDNQEIEVMMLDTDSFNGNLGRTEILIDKYRKIKSASSENIDGGHPNTDTFFSAKLNFYKFCADYNANDRITYKNISQLSNGSEEARHQNKLLSDLFLDSETVQEFHLDHGYRAQTHLGSHLMYHGIIEAARHLSSGKDKSDSEKNLEEFLSKLEAAAENARVFVFGSVFGGTGASSIPIIPVAFRDAVSIRSQGKSTLDLSKTKFGSTLLTDYFSFKKPDLKQMSVKKDSIVADSTFFPLNSQAALQFYQQDPTVKSIYKRMYHVGWPLESKPLSDKSSNKTITGGKEQENNCHIVELLCACAAYDFFTLDDSLLEENKVQYLFRSAPFENNTFSFTADDLVGDKGSVFANKLGAFLSFAHIALSRNHAAWGDKGTRGFLRQLKDNNIKDYDTIPEEATVLIDEYLKLFCYQFDNQKQFVPGWIYQIRKSVEPGSFLFRPDAFKTTQSDLAKLDVGSLFIDEKNHWPKSGFLGSEAEKRYDVFVKSLTSNGHPKDSQNVTTTKEQFLAHIYNGITLSQNFKNED